MNLRHLFDGIAHVTGCCLLALATCASASDRLVMETPLRALTSADSEMFPDSWRAAPIEASGNLLPETEFKRAREILGRAASKYPPSVLQTHLKQVYVLSDLRYLGVVTSGTNSRTVVYLKVGDPAQGFTDPHIERVFHAEFSSILLRNCKQLFDADAWNQVNPPGFAYLGNGVDAIKQRKAGLRLSDDLHEQGFFREYSQSTMENDLNAFAALIFSGDAELWKTAERFPKLKQKLALTLNFYRRIDPTFTEMHFRSLIRQ